MNISKARVEQAYKDIVNMGYEQGDIFLNDKDRQSIKEAQEKEVQKKK